MTSFVGQANYSHDSQAKTGVLLVNLGTPDAPTTSAVRKYLAEFLWDPRVVEQPRALWWLILHGIILRLRPRRSAKLYQKVWTTQGSPLLVYSRLQEKACRKSLEEKYGKNIKVALAMRYGNPSVATGMKELRAAGVTRFLVLPLYPQYSATTTASVFDAVSEVLQQWRWLPELRFIMHYHDNGDYIQAMAKRIQSHWHTHGRGDKLIFSFHGIPKSYFLNGDPYFCECQKTARLLADALNLTNDQWQITFQSRVGREEWLQPYTDKVLKALPSEVADAGVQLAEDGGVKTAIKSVDIFCPGFSADCLETLEEIEEENKKYFLQAGGTQYHYIPALNDTPEHIAMLVKLIENNLQGWVQTISSEEFMTSKARAMALGAEQ